MKAVFALFLVLVVCPLAVRMDDDDLEMDMEMDMEDWLPAIIAGNILGNQNCVQYGKASNGQRCCQYLGYTRMANMNGQCLQANCASGVGARCSAAFHCCYHEELTCFLESNTCGYNNYPGRK